MLDTQRGIDNLTKMRDGKLYGNSHGLIWEGFNIHDFWPFLDFETVSKRFYSEIVEIDNSDRTKMIYVSNTHFGGLSASAISPRYIILGNPFSSGKICIKP